MKFLKIFIIILLCAASCLIFRLEGFSITISIDGINDFDMTSNVILTSTPGYTNWITWDDNYLYIGYFGTGLADNLASTMLIAYFSTNTNSGGAYGAVFDSQGAVLPYRADFLFRYDTTYSWDSAVWNGTGWNWSSPFSITPSSDLMTNGSYLEFRISRANLGNSPYLDCNLYMVKPSGMFGAVPNVSFSDGFGSYINTFLNFGTDFTESNIISSNAIYEVVDTNPVLSNTVLFPSNGQTNVWGERITLTNFAWQAIGLRNISYYTNNHYMFTISITNYESNFTWDIDTNAFPPGTYDIYSMASNTSGGLLSATNTFVILSAPDLVIIKTVDNIQLGSTNFSWPGALILYKIMYSNQGDGYATNVVLFEKIPEHSTYYTNYLGAATTGWETQYAHIDNPDQSYGSTDYDSDNTGVKWVRWRKTSIASDEDDRTIYLGVTID